MLWSLRLCGATETEVHCRIRGTLETEWQLETHASIPDGQECIGVQAGSYLSLKTWGSMVRVMEDKSCQELRFIASLD